MKTNELKTEDLAWCYDLRSGWSEVENVVCAGLPDGTNMMDATERAGYGKLATLGEVDAPVYLEIYSKRVAGPGPRYYLSVELSGTGESVYVTNLPSLVGFLRDFAPILQAGILTDLALAQTSVKSL